MRNIVLLSRRIGRRCVVSDIVTRLRELREVLMGNPIMAREVQEAMDEIERLRADVKRWRNWAEEFFYTDPDCECPLCDQVREAIGKTI